jgi:prepilin-type N-terminal cleavage/methylation domain-containing protein
MRGILQRRYIQARQPGFTLVEIIVTIAAIGIIATIATVAFTEVQKQSRDAERQANAVTITEALETYYDKNGEYPSCTQMTGSPSSVASLLGVDANTLQIPTKKDGSNAIQCGDTAGIEERYQYVGDGSNTCASISTGSCLKYTFRYKEEASSEFVAIESRRTGLIGGVGRPVLTVGTLTYTSAALTWTTVPNTINYTIEYSTASNFADSSFVPNLTDTALTLNDLEPGTPYYVRVVANANADQLASDPVTATPRSLGKPTITVTASDWENASVGWAAIADAQEYVIQQSETSSFDDNSEDTIAGGTLSYNYTSLEGGKTYYYRLKATREGVDGPWSDTVSRAQPPSGVSGVTATTQNTTTIRVCWNSIAGANSYIIRQSTSSSMASATSATGITGTCSDRGSLTPGKRYYFTVTPFSTSSGEGTPSPVVNAITNINAPAAPSISSGFVSGNIVRGTASGSSCPTGTTLQRTVRYRSSTRSSSLGSWSSWLAWGSNTYSVSQAQGRRYDFQALARCVGTERTSANSATSSTASSTAGINTPSAPTWPSGMSKSWANLSAGHYMWYGTYCPSGTWVGWNEFNSRAWNGATPRDYYHAFGFNDYWRLGPSGATVEYWASYDCRTDFAVSPRSGSSYDTIWVYR